MITKFDSSYAGHIDMEDLGYGGVPVNDRVYPNEQLATALGKAEAMAKLMDRVGFNAFWMAEHHFQPEGYECIPNVLMMALHLTHVTKHLKVGCGFNITPMWHPLRLAEDYAMADILSGGRVIFGVGRGYHTREVETFGAPLIDQSANRELFEEQVDIIFKSFESESFAHKGKYYTLPPEVPYRGYTLKEITLVPRPLRQPVECWQPIQGGTQRGVRLHGQARHLRRHRRRLGRGRRGGPPHGGVPGARTRAAASTIELGERLSLGYQFLIAESREAGMREAAKYYEENMKMFGELRLVRAMTDEQIEIMRDRKRAPTAKLPRIEDAVKAGGFLTGTPDDIIAQLKAVEARYPGLDRVTCSMAIGVPLNVALEQLQRFAEEVMPAFKGAKVAAPALAG